MRERLTLSRNEPSLENTFGGFTEGDLDLPDELDVPVEVGTNGISLRKLERASEGSERDILLIVDDE